MSNKKAKKKLKLEEKKSEKKAKKKRELDEEQLPEGSDLTENALSVLMKAAPMKRSAREDIGAPKAGKPRLGKALAPSGPAVREQGVNKDSNE